MPRVLISYSHDSDEHAERVLALSDRLRTDGVDCRIDQYLEDGPPQGWPLWMDEELDAADAVLILFTKRYAEKAKEKKRSGVKFESVLVLQDLYEAGMLNEKFIPVVFDSSDAQYIVKWLRPYNYYALPAGYEKLLRRLLNDPEVIMPPVGTAVKKGPRNTSKPAPRVKLTHLPAAGPLLIGREAEMARLDAAWHDPAKHVISIVARGGEGKTNLVRYWLNKMSAENWPSVEAVFAWSFFSQGTQDKAASADQFVDQALRFFGETDPESIKSPYARGERLAELIGAGRNLLILDGLEPLQYPPSGMMGGRLKDPALQTLLSGLSMRNAGLCVITTRESLPELAAGHDTISPEIELTALSDKAGAELLQRLGVTGTDAQRTYVSRRLGGHALSLQLLGSYLDEVYDGDVTRAGKVALLDQDPLSSILESYERWLSGRTLAPDDPGRAEVERSGAPMLSILRLLGLFTGPAEMGLIDVLRAAPAINGLTEPLVGLSPVEWKRALARLRKLKLIDNDRTAIDAHPLIREHYAAQLAEQFPEAAREAHGRLFDQLKKSAPELPETLQEMMPLYAAVRHGCQADRWQEALDDVFHERIRRGREGYSRRKLGAFGMDLEAMSGFMSDDSYTPTAHLSESARAWVLEVMGFSLKALARLHEARRLLEVGLDMTIQQESWLRAAGDALNLSGVHLVLGEVSTAVRWAAQAIELSDRQDVEKYDIVFSVACLGKALHAAGAFDAALAAFDDQLKVHRARSAYPILYSVQGFDYRELLLDSFQTPTPETVRQAREEAQETLKLYEKELSIAGSLDYARDHVTLARTYLLENSVTPGRSLGKSASFHAEKAMALFRDAGEQNYLLYGFLCRAAVRRTWPDLESDSLKRADNDLAEVEQIANRSGMISWQIEAGVERTRLHLARGEKDEAKKKLEETKLLIHKTMAPFVPYRPQWGEWQPPSYVNTFAEGEMVGYNRCKADIEALEQLL
ncbi:MAG TPA: SEFIR domain-containing protein [Thermoanaerobaculia bacterium]|jgi:tetratricopeptide (TPR) repeat protein